MKTVHQTIYLKDCEVDIAIDSEGKKWARKRFPYWAILNFLQLEMIDGELVTEWILV